MTKDQKTVAAGAASGIAAMILSLWLFYTILPDPASPAMVGERLGYAARWIAFAALPLFAMLGAVGNARFLSEAIDPTVGKESASMTIDGRVADNTLQQFVLFAAGALSLAAATAGHEVKIVGAAAITFFIMRIAFWIGYRIKPVYRAFGFSSTAYMNLGLLLGAMWLSLS